MTEMQEIVTWINQLDRVKLETAFPRVDAAFRNALEQQKVPGLAYGIVIDNELVYARGIGIQNMVTQTPVTPDSVFRIASMTKSFTAMAIIKLRDEGKLRLDEPVATYVPELAALRYPTRDSAPMTVRQLLTMNGGLPEDNPWADRQLANTEAALSERLAGGIPFSNTPGVTFEYSNYGYAILGRIVTNVAGMRYQDYVRTQILEPLGMSSSGFDIHAVQPERLAMGYRRESDAWFEETPLPDGAFASIGGLFTTVTDFARYMSYLLSAFPPRDDAEQRPIRRSSLREMQQPWQYRAVSSMRATPDAPAWVQSEGYGFGLGVGVDSRLGYTVSHGGGLPGYGTFYRLLPDCGIGIVLLTNLTYNPSSLRVNEAYAELQKTGGLKPRRLAPAPALLEVQQAVTALYNQWDEAQMTAISTGSFFLDMPLDKRHEQFEGLRASLGKCRSVTPFEPENALRGRWTMRCTRGQIEAFVTMAPTMPPRIQDLELTAAKPLRPALKQTVTTLVSLIGQWDDAQAQTIFARSLKRVALRGQFEALRVQYGRLRLGATLEGDGERQARIRLNGERGIVDMKVVLAKSGKIADVTFTRPRETAFVP